MGYRDVTILQLRTFCATVGDTMLQDRSLLLLRDASRVFAFAAAVLLLFSPWAIAQDEAIILGDDTVSAREAGPMVRPVRTDSPRDTLKTFLRLRDDFEESLTDYRANRSVEGAEQLSLLAAQFRALIDLSEVASTSRSEVGNDTLGYLLDIFYLRDDGSPQRCHEDP